MSHSGQPEEYDKFEKFVQKKVPLEQTVSTNNVEPSKFEQNKTEFAKTLEYLKDVETGEYASDPDWKKFKQFLQHEADAEKSHNDSGQGKLSRLPAGVGGLNWGAFILSVIWGGVMKVPGMTLLGWTFLMLLPIVGFIFPFYLLFKGDEIAWQSRRWATVEEFRTVQRKWTLIGFALGGVVILFVILIALWIYHMIGSLLGA